MSEKVLDGASYAQKCLKSNKERSLHLPNNYPTVPPISSPPVIPPQININPVTISRVHRVRHQIPATLKLHMRPIRIKPSEVTAYRNDPRAPTMQFADVLPRCRYARRAVRLIAC